MRTSLLVTCLILCATTAWATPNPELVKSVLEKQTICQNFVRLDDTNIYLGFTDAADDAGTTTLAAANRIRVLPLNGSASFDLALPDSPVDMVTQGNRAFVLTAASLLELDLTTQQIVAQHPTYQATQPFLQKQEAMSLALYKNTLIIAHGRLGVAFFDIPSGQITRQYKLIQTQGALESMATGVTVQGPYAYVAMDNYTVVDDGTPAFRGLVVINLDTQAVVSQSSGMDPGADRIVSDASTLVVSFGGNPLWQFPISSFKAGHPEREVFQFPLKGHPTGAPAMDASYYYTCFAKTADVVGQPVTFVPVALSRQVLKLN